MLPLVEMFAISIFLLYQLTAVLGRRDHSVRVSVEVKDQILSANDVDSAYQMYLKSYQSLDSNGPAMLKMVDPVTQERENERKKNNFMTSLAKAKAHNVKFENGESR